MHLTKYRIQFTMGWILLLRNFKFLFLRGFNRFFFNFGTLDSGMNLVLYFVNFRKFCTNAQNVYVLKICLNLFEISNWVLKFENLIQIRKKCRLSLYGTWKQEYLPTEIVSSHWTKSQKQFTVEFYEQSPPSKHLVLNQIKTYLRYILHNNLVTRDSIYRQLVCIT